MYAHILYELGSDRHRELIKEADQHRLVMQALAGQPSLIVRLQGKLGSFLIKIGGKLQKRHALQSTGRLGWAER